MKTQTSTHRGLHALRIAAIACGLVGLSACTDRAADRTAGQQVDRAVEKTEDAAVAAARKAAELAEVARDKTREFATSPEVRKDAAAVGQALKNAGSTVVATTQDASITASVSAGLARDSELSATRIDVSTRDGAVSLRGPAPSADAKSRASEIARSVQGVSSVDNQLEVRPM